MKNILITGGAGFIGSNLIASLIQKNFRVICVDNFDHTYDPKLKEENIDSFIQNKNFILYRTDICDMEAMRQIFANEKPHHVIHLAAKADTRAAVEDPFPYISVNVLGSMNMLELSRDFGVASVVMASSGSVYGNNPNIPWKEDDNTDFPLSAYGASKKMMEMLSYGYFHNFGMNVICLRYFNVYGENVRPAMVPYKWAEAFLTGQEIELSGEGVRRRDFTYVGDVVRATEAALHLSGYEVINIADSSPHSLLDLLEVFKKVTGANPPVRRRESHRASVNETYADNTKAKKILNWEPQVSLEEGIKKLVFWFRDCRLQDLS
jgi:UDP-glucuronate 4-epimerase